MRNVFVKILMKNVEIDKDFILLSGDLGFRAFEEFIQRYPKQFCNLGNAEANMVGVAAGLALTGKKVCVYSIVPFVTMRCYEQIRNSVCLPNLNVNFIGAGGGFSYGIQGFSHNTIEDLAIMRVLPNMNIFCPGDRIEAELAIEAAIKDPGPAYIRLGKAGEKKIYLCQPRFELGKSILVKPGNDLTLITIGNIIEDVAEITERLENRGLNVRMVSSPCLKPIDKKMIFEAAQETKAIFTIEEHSLFGGLGSSVAEILLETDYSNIVFKRFAIPDQYCQEVGSQSYLRKINGLSVEQITQDILEILKNVKF